MNEVILKCSSCKCALAWHVPGEDYSICSSEYVEGFKLCRSCLIEHCLATNCLGCRLGKYPECSFLPIKKFHREYKDD